MARNYEGEKKQMQYTEDFIIADMENCFSEQGCTYTKDEQIEMRHNPALYFESRYLREYDCDFVRQSNRTLQQRIADFLSKIGFTTIDIYSDDQLELRDKWGYKTDDDKWLEGFFPRIANNIIRWCSKKGVDLYKSCL